MCVLCVGVWDLMLPCSVVKKVATLAREQETDGGGER